MKFFNLDTEFTFGEFDGKTLKQVLEIQPSYIDWCAVNIDQFYVTDVVIEEIKTFIPDFAFTEKGKRMLADKYSEWQNAYGLNDEDDGNYSLLEEFEGSYTQDNRKVIDIDEDMEDSLD